MMKQLLKLFILPIIIFLLFNNSVYATSDLDLNNEIINIQNNKIDELINYIENYNKYEYEHSIFSFIIIFIYSIIILAFILFILNKNNKDIKFNLKELLICIIFLCIFIYFITGGNIIKTNDKNIDYKDYFAITDYQ